MKKTHLQRQIETHRQPDRPTETDRDKQTHLQRQIETDRHRQPDR